MSRPSQRIEGSEKNMAVETVSMPVSLLEKMVEAAREFEAFENELEDHLLSQDAAFVARMRQAREHHVQGEARPLDALKHELCIEQRPGPTLPSAFFAFRVDGPAPGSAPVSSSPST